MARANNSKSFGVFSRLRQYSTVIDEEQNTIRFGMRDSAFFDNLKLFASSSVYTVPSKFEYRPDLISNEQYDTPELWWVLVGYNNMFHPFKEFKTGAIIRIPDQTTIDGLLI